MRIVIKRLAAFLFKESYKPSRLSEVNHPIKTYNYLSGISFAKVIKGNGMKVGEFQMKFLKKIEELTLSTIEKYDQVKKQEYTRASDKQLQQ